MQNWLAIWAKKMIPISMTCPSHKRSTNQDPSAIRTSQELLQDIPARKISLLSRPFGLGWLDKNKDKSAGESNQVKSSDELKGLNTLQKDINGLKMEELSVGTRVTYLQFTKVNPFTKATEWSNRA
ncbi:hypothetical protein Tco_1184646 [Tanacetum coccineum]